MNDQPLSLFPDASQPATTEKRAQRIRDLVGTARTCIIEIGRELIAAKAEVGHGNWLAWLDAEFGWSQPTAFNYMRVAEAFKLSTVDNFTGLTIDATALYALAAPGVDPALRHAVVEAAEEGERITIDEANRIAAEMVAAKTRELTERFNADHEEVRKSFEDLQARVDGLTSETNEPQPPAPPTVEDAVQMLLKLTGKKKLSDGQAQALAKALEKPVAYLGKIFPPVTEDKSRKAEQDLQVSSACGRVMEYFTTAPPASDVAASMPDWMLTKMAAALPVVKAWLDDFKIAIEGR